MRPYVILLLMLMIITGCGLISKEPSTLVQETQNTMKEAQDNFDAVERLQIQELYPYDFQEAHNELISAENYLQEKHYDQALSSALRSLAASQRIFRQLYRDIIIPSAQEAKTEIWTSADDDPNDPLLEFLSMLNEILDYSDKIENGHYKIDPAKVVEDFNKVAQIDYNAQLTTGKILRTEISFAPGQYYISNEGRGILNEFCENIIANKRKYINLYPDKIAIIKIKVVGYTDQIDFREGTNLIDRLAKDASDKIPESQSERKKFLNQRLSELRARTVGDYLKQFIRQADQEPPQAQIEQEILGLGEEIPPGVSPPYAISDPRRRICKILSYITMY